MNETPRAKLREIIRRHGVDVYKNKSRCKGLLLDYCGTFRKEFNVLVAAWSFQNVLLFMQGISGKDPSLLLQYAICPFILLVVGAISRNSTPTTFGKSVRIVLAGDILFMAYVLVRYMFVFHYTFSEAFSALLPFQLISLIIVLVAAIPVHIIIAMLE